MERTEHSYAVDGVRSGYFYKDGKDGLWSCMGGTIDTPWGIVNVNTYEDAWTKATDYTFIYGGRRHKLRERGVTRTHTGAAIVAGRWVRGIVGEES